MSRPSPFANSGSGARIPVLPGVFFLLLAAAALGGALWWRRERPPAKVPAAQWAWKAPEAAGYSTARLAEFATRAGGTGAIIQRGEIICAWGDLSKRYDVASASKPILAFFVFQAIEQGRLRSLDQKVARWLPEIATLNPSLGSKDRDITFRHLLQQTSGYGLQERPGEAFAYNDNATALLAWVVLHNVHATPWKRLGDLLNGPLLGGAIGFEDRPTIDSRVPNFGRISISVRDLARFGLLYLRGGEWAGRRVLSRRLFRQALSGCLLPDFPRTSGQESPHLRKLGSIGGGKNEKNHLGCLGSYWWFNCVTPDGTRLLPAAPPRTFLSIGYGGRHALVVVPELDLVAVWLGVHPGAAWSPFSEIGRFQVNEMVRELLSARIPAAP